MLLKNLGVRGIQREFESLVEDVKGHALTLNLLGSYLHDAHGGDIRKHDIVKLEEADAEEQGGHAFHVMDAYVKSFESEGDKGKRALAVLRLLGLFDRPMSADCFDALLKAPAITGLTEALVGMSEAQRNVVFTRLEAAKLLTVNRETGGGLISLDAHPLLREYFAQKLRAQHPEAWRAGHRRIYEHLCETTNEGDHPTLEELQPLYQAIAHGCQAGMQVEACDNVYHRRIQRGRFYSMSKLGAIGADLGAAACFFDKPWSHVSPALTEDDRAWLLADAAFSLRALGRLTEALEPMRTSLEMRIKHEDWQNAAIGAGNLSGLELMLGEVAGAVRDAARSVTFADRSGVAFQRTSKLATHADALHQAGRHADADARFREAEIVQTKAEPEFPLLYSMRGFRYCDVLLALPECATWKTMLGKDQRVVELTSSQESQLLLTSSLALTASCQAVSQRAGQTLRRAKEHLGLIDVALDHRTLGRAALFEEVLKSGDVQLSGAQMSWCGDPTSERFDYAHHELDAAVDGLRRASTSDYIPSGLLSRAWLRSLTGQRSGHESAQSDLDEAWEIAERGPMRLFIADIHLYRARLFFREREYPWNKNPDGTARGPKDDLAAAGKLINDCGYHRRDEELADAKRAILGE
jgi:hypothetical protein